VPLSTDDMLGFIRAYPGMTLLPALGSEIVFEGRFEFTGSWLGAPNVTDAYELKIEVPEYPEQLPRVFETGGRIPKNIDEHVFSRSGQLCLGSELRLRMKIGARLNVVDFADQCIVPFLYSTTRRQTEGHFVLGELDHGNPGLFDDYQDIFGISNQAGVLAALRILATKPSSAGKHPCPCGCGKRLAQCQFGGRIDDIRKIAPRKCFQQMNAAIRGKTSGKRA
jgi:hypothetical protein